MVPEEAKTRSACDGMTDCTAGWRDVARSDHRNRERRAVKRQMIRSHCRRRIEVPGTWDETIKHLASLFRELPLLRVRMTCRGLEICRLWRSCQTVRSVR